MTEHTNTPELRFPEFNEEWREFNLKDISTKKNKKNKNKLYNETFTNSAEYGIVSQKDYFDKEISNVRNLSNYYIVDPDDFVYNPRISRLAPVGPINRNKLNRIGVMSPLYTVFSTKLSIKSFLEYYFKTTKWHKFMKLNGDSGARSDRFTIKQSLFVKMPIVLPSEQEQEKIGKFFSKLDQQIELEEKKLELLEQQKKGYMQTIFSQELRFKDENGNNYSNWEKVKFNYFMSKPNKLEKGKDIQKDQLLTVKLQGNGVCKANINRALKLGSTVYYKRFTGQFIYGKQNFFNGAFGIVPDDLNCFYSSGDVPALNLDNNKITNDYFINYISRKDYYKKKEAFSTGTGSKRIHEDTLLEFDIMLPSIEEQNKIGNFFNKLHELIEIQSSKVELLEERKKGLLQKMFV